MLVKLGLTIKKYTLEGNRKTRSDFFSTNINVINIALFVTMASVSSTYTENGMLIIGM